ncbi:MAG: hypothetical protein ACI3XF_07600 [Eubacteriales bacterium]
MISGKEAKAKRRLKMNDPYSHTRDAFMSNPVVSANDCTGITQHIPETGDEAEAYTDIYDVPVTALDHSSKHKKAR